MKKLFIFFLLLAILVFSGYDTIWASVQTDIEEANQAGKTVFLVVTEPGVPGAEKALTIAEQAHEAAADSTVIEMNRSDSTNSPLVTMYRLAASPLPLILVIASNGAVAGGFPADRATPDQLVKMVPSPKKADVLRALKDGKAVFVVASRESMEVRDQVLEVCRAARSQMENRAALVTIDMDDKRESPFLAQIRANTLSTEPVTCVINRKGQTTAVFNGPVEAAALIQATAKIAGGCCPAGGKKKCGPGNSQGK